MHESVTGRTRLRAGDRVCFYVTRLGIAATATITAAADALIPDEEIPIGPRCEPLYRDPVVGATVNVDWVAVVW